MGFYRPKVMLIVVMLIALVLLGMATFVAARDHRANQARAAQPPQIEYRTWNHYVPVASQDCLKAIDLGDDAITAGLKLDEITTAALADKNEGRLADAIDGFAKAKKQVDVVHKARVAYDKQAGRCVRS